MDFGFSEPQEMFRRTVRDFLEKECPLTLVREMQEKKQDFDQGLYRKMAGLGWSGIMIPEEYGGVGGNWVDMAIFYEEVGRALLSSPHLSTVVLGGQILLAMGSEEQRSELLPRIAKGEIVIALALTEPEAGGDTAHMTTTATMAGDEYVISGTKLFVSNAHLADSIIVVAQTGRGVTLFIVDGKSEGLTCTPLDTFTGERTCLVVFDKVKVHRSRMVGSLDQGGRIAELMVAGPEHYAGVLDIMDRAKIMGCAELMGGAQVALEEAIDFSKQRVQFDKPIGSFQALQHKLADMAMAVEGARWLTYMVAWMNSEGIPCAKETAMAQLEVGRVCTVVTREALHVHGAVAMMADHDLPLYLRKAKAGQLSLGYQEGFREVIAQGIGL
jgi:alkylation response protein AidB-like acyl-CoA dehydrogenase